MTKTMDFFKPSWKKIYWLLLVYLVGQIYSTIIINAVPSSLMASFISFLLNPASMLFTQARGVDAEILIPVAKTIDLLWMYLVAAVLAKEISKDKD
ncbi:MAG: hypothetical protein WCW13_02660 [archaeon]|jgi:hypothetical protein